MANSLTPARSWSTGTSKLASIDGNSPSTRFKDSDGLGIIVVRTFQILSRSSDRTDWTASLLLAMTRAGTDRILWLSPKMTKEKRCHPELVSGSHYSIYPLVFVCKIYEMPKQVRHDSEVRVRCVKKVEKYEMLKRVQHDNLVCVGRIVLCRLALTRRRDAETSSA